MSRVLHFTNSRSAMPRLDGASARPPVLAEPLGELLRLLGASDDDARVVGGPLGAVPTRRVTAGEALFHEGAPAETIHVVRVGSFKVFRTTEDGYEQVLAFAGRAELLGYEALAHGRHPNAAVALEDSTVFSLTPAELFDAVRRVPLLDRLLHRAVSDALADRGEQAGLMAPVAAEVRLARFLLQLSRRQAASGQSPRRFHLRMGRRDIASYLGVAHETVSRSFGALVRWGLAVTDNREVELLDLPGLQAFAANTRRPVDDGGHAPHRARAVAVVG